MATQEKSLGGMKAPPSGAYKIVSVPEAHKAMLDQYCIAGTYVGQSEEESPWVPFGDNAAIRHLAFDVRNNVYANVLWIKSPGVMSGRTRAARPIRIPAPAKARATEALSPSPAPTTSADP